MFTLNCNGNLLIAQEPLVMGIINVTADSFYADSRVQQADAIVKKAVTMVEEGASIIDLGAQSTRPGSTIMDIKTEVKTLIPVIKTVRETLPTVPLSVDTYYADVAEAAIEAGASIINDISGGRFFPEILHVAARRRVPYICMHSHGTRETMHEKLMVPNISATLFQYFSERISAAEKAGVVDFIIDPGFGFGKTIPDNFQIIKELSQLTIFRKPILVGVSRKSSIYQTLGTTADKALNGTTVLHTKALLNGASILRVHDVREAVEAVKLVQFLS
jgi:dihydropteroate synthase